MNEWKDYKLSYETPSNEANRISEELFKKVKAAIALRRARKAYKNMEEVRTQFGVGKTSFWAIVRSRTIKEYRNNRKRASRPQKYGKTNADR